MALNFPFGFGFSKGSSARIPSAPLIHYACEDNAASTVVVNKGTSGSNGTSLRNTSVFSTASGHGGSGFDFYTGSSTDRIDFNCGTLTNFSVSMWLAPDTEGGGSTGRIFDIENSTCYAATSYTTNRIVFTCGTSLIVDNGWAASTWRHYIFVRSDTTGTIYINGLPTSGPCGSGVWQGTGSFGDCDASYLDRHYDGKMDDIRVYNYALSTAQAGAIYNGWGTP